MKRTLLLTSLLNLFVLWLFAAHVDEQTAKTVGGNFLSSLATASDRSPNELQLVFRSGTDGYVDENVTYFYVFQDQHGFVIVSGDDRSIPILAYSDQGEFDANDMPPSARKWLEGYKTQLRDIIVNDVAPTEEITSQWERFAHGSVGNESRAAVNPLVDTRWDQSPFVNALCPGGSVTGCVATAMAQIMKYWDYPTNGSGFHSYNHNTYGTLSASFGNTTYQWGSMPNNVNSSNNAVATLMYHCGVSVDMQYSPQVSNAYVINSQSPIQHCSEYALKTYFGYDPSMQGVVRSGYNDNQWINLLKGELDASRPILYAGFGSGGGHAFVCDGYDNNNFFHFNWGWGGAYDGFFSINALNPSGTGTGGGSGGYNSGHQILKGIKPPGGGGGGGGGGNDTYNLALYNFVTPSASTIYYGQSFSITSNILNQGQNDFSGDYGAAVFDSQGNFIDFVEVLTGYTLPSGYTYNNNLVFSTTGLFSMLPGTYYAGIFYKPASGNWIAVADYNSYQNVTQINVINPNSIEMNAAMSVSSGSTVTQGQNVSVNLNILNDGNTNFYGTYSLDLYSLDGDYVQSIGSINENNGLPPGYTYLSPFLTFSNTITAAPGTYLLAVTHLQSGSSNWQLTGSSYYQNPIFLTVQAPSLSPDQYEANNTNNQAYTLSSNFSGNSANSNTNGSNLHTGEDNDFYAVNLASGYDYTISARIHDSYNSGNGNTYSVDALFSYSMDGNNWSDSYDDVMPGNITVSNGGMVYFHVAPYFAGETGTYLLDMNITRSPHTGIEEPEALKNIRVYPNPAVDLVTVDLSDSEGKLEMVELMAIDGKVVQSSGVTNDQKLIRIPLNDAASGVYVMRLTTDKGIAVRRIVIQK